MGRDGVAARARLVAGGACSGPGISRIPDDLASGLPSPQVRARIRVRGCA